MWFAVILSDLSPSFGMMPRCRAAGLGDAAPKPPQAFEKA